MKRLTIIISAIEKFFRKLFTAILPQGTALKQTILFQIVFCTLFWIAVTIAMHEPNNFWFVSPGILLLGLLCAVFFAILATAITRVFQYLPFWLITGILFSLIIAAITTSMVANYWTIVLTINLWLILPPILIGFGRNYLLKHSNHKIISSIIGWLFIGLGSISIIIGIVWLAFPGFTSLNKPIIVQDNRQPAAQIQAENPGEKGLYEILTLTYGSGNDLQRPEYGEQADLITNTVDGSAFLPSLDKIPSWIYQKQWGFNKTSLPLNGSVWYPQGDGPFPLVLIVHGNHTAEDYSDGGYAYLGELFASRGMIAVSVDENFLNSSILSSFSDNYSTKENDARGWLLLQHLQQWRQWNKQKDTPFYQKVDLNQIALIGHSRGGEAVTEAVAFNTLGLYPDNGQITLPEPFNIKAIIAIAPVDKQYNPAGIDTPLENIDYLVLQGSADADVDSFAGLAAYTRVKFTETEDFHFKSVVYIHRANHGQFNSSWGDADGGKLSRYILDRNMLINADDQEKITRICISAFLEASLLQNDNYIPLFKEIRSGADWLPQTAIWTQYADNRETTILNFEEDINLQTGSIPTISLEAKRVTGWRETILKGTWNRSIGDSVVKLSWDHQEHPLPHYDITFSDPISFSLNQDFIFSAAVRTEKESEKNETIEPADFSIQLSDGEHFAKLNIEPYALLYNNPTLSLTKAAYMDEIKQSELIMQTIQIPFSDFVDKNPQLNLSHIKLISINFDQTSAGDIWIDNIGYR
ncbi:MAG: hypothetical protein JEZ00_21225 [Anaerolineaceae bacterium]|nr:hypothetical protein [Anaerolineaceae bacterium]